jgi:hypothetical protein
MSALGQNATCASQKVMSALPPTADMCGATRDVRFGPIADMSSETLLAHLKGITKRTLLTAHFSLEYDTFRDSRRMHKQRHGIAHAGHPHHCR